MQLRILPRFSSRISACRLNLLIFLSCLQARSKGSKKMMSRRIVGMRLVDLDYGFDCWFKIDAKSRILLRKLFLDTKQTFN